MSEGFELEPFHVPQRSRRDKLRENATTLHGGCAGLLPIYDPSLLSSSMLTCATSDMHHHPNQPFISTPIKEEGMNFMGFVGLGSGFLPSSSSSSSSSQLLLDLTQSSIALNPTCNQQEYIDSSSNPFLYSSQIPQNLRDFDPQPLSYAPQDTITTGQGLSLSLSSHCRNRSDAAGFDEKGVGNYAVRGSSVPIGPFTGYAAILKASRFLKPTQQLLDEFCDVGRGFYMDRSVGGESSSSSAGREMENLSENGGMDDGLSDRGGERRRMKARLISMLNEVYRRYKQYYQQLLVVVTSFESVAGLSTAAPYTSLALKALSKHFRCLKNTITDQLRLTSKVFSEGRFGKEENPSFGLVDQGIRQQNVAQNLSIHEQPCVWRPQRGLPERAVTVLRAWLYEHFLHPYPTDADKQLLAKQTGLSRNQVSNWFINARVRLWKPMVEEIHTLEMRQAQRVSEGVNNNANEQCELPVGLHQKNRDPPLQHSRNELAQLPNNCDESVNFSYDNVSGRHGVGVSISQASGNGGVSLTLGLHQNNGGGLSEPLPVTVAHFGLEDNNGPYVMGGFESQNRQFGRDIGRQLLHDFVG